jgi:hypothetical protein
LQLYERAFTMGDDIPLNTMPALFEMLRAMRAFERRYLHFLVTLEDFDLVREIGYHQAHGAPLTMKQIYLLGIGSVATVQRRLRRLRELGAIQQRRTARDARNLELTITPKVLRTYAKYGELLGLLRETTAPAQETSKSRR